MNPIIDMILAGLGWGMLWGLGLIAVPILIALGAIVFARADEGTASVVWCVSMFLYFVASAIALIVV